MLNDRMCCAAGLLLLAGFGVTTASAQSFINTGGVAAGVEIFNDDEDDFAATFGFNFAP